MTVERNGTNYNDVIIAQKTYWGTIWETWVIHGLDGNDTLAGGEDNDYLYGEAGNDTLAGGGDNDWLDGGTGVDTMQGGMGDDIYIVDNAGDQAIEVTGAGIDEVRSSAYSYSLSNTSNIEKLFLINDAYEGNGNNESNTIAGTNLDNRLHGWGGHDSISGYGGRDRMFGGSGSDSLYGGDGHDSIHSYNDTNSSYGDDSSVDSLWGGNGNDVLYAGSGSDYLYGEADADSLISGTDNLTDFLYGGYGNDTYFIKGAASITEYADGGTDMMYTDSENYTLPEPTYSLNLENLMLGVNVMNGSGNRLNNEIWGSGQNNRIDGKGGHDTLHGNQGADMLLGGDGIDVLNGGDNDDFLNGYNATLADYQDTEIDVLTGGGGADRFFLGSNHLQYNVYSRSDYALITDYNRAEGDKIEVFGISSKHFQDYNLVQNADLTGNAALDTQIFYKNELIAIVNGNSTMTVGQDLTFAGSPGSF